MTGNPFEEAREQLRQEALLQSADPVPTTDNIPNAIVGSRRATALLSHWSRQDAAGFHAVVAELPTGRATVDLVMGLCTAAELLGERVFGGPDGWRDFLDSHALELASWEAHLPAPPTEPTENGEDDQ